MGTLIILGKGGMKVRKRETASMKGIREMSTLVTNEFYE